MIRKSRMRYPMTPEKPFRNDRLTYRLNMIADQAIAANEDIFIRETGCNIRELRVLRLIDDTPGTSFAEISRITGFERSLTSRIIQALIAAGLIIRENSAIDARVFQLSTTPKGKEVRRIGRNVSDRLEAILTQPLSSAELETLNQLLSRLGTWVSSAEYQDLLAQE
ncbi:MAG: MarR family winged helix-turn-helix transcriptional regulator [Roseinatronobacter sp.]|nr:MarR family winged helix-turn-helix transcriptional regulator [Roseinatronobacter sp.]